MSKIMIKAALAAVTTLAILGAVLAALVYGADNFDRGYIFLVLAGLVSTLYAVPPLNRWVREVAASYGHARARTEADLLRHLRDELGLTATGLPALIAELKARDEAKVKAEKELRMLQLALDNLYEVARRLNADASRKYVGPKPTTPDGWVLFVQTDIEAPWEVDAIASMSAKVDIDELTRLRREARDLKIAAVAKDGSLMEAEVIAAEHGVLGKLVDKHGPAARRAYARATATRGTEGEEILTALVGAVYGANLILLKESQLSKGVRTVLTYIVGAYGPLTKGQVLATPPAQLKEEVFN